MRLKLFVTAAAAVIASSALETRGSAATLVDTGAPVTAGSGWAISATQSLGAEFTLSQASTITSVEAWMRSWDLSLPGGASISVSITNDGGDIPGATKLFTASFVTEANDTWDGVYGVNWSLAAGTYWLTFTGSEAVGDLIGARSPNPLGNEVYMSGGIWRNADSQDLAVRIMGSAVPEPGTWALMLFGFGAIGVSMRRRRVLAIARMA